MKWSPVIASLLISAGLHAQDQDQTLRLRWKNGETLSGHILGASSSVVRWSTPLFANPLELQWHVLRRVDRILPPSEVTEPFTISLRDGSQLHGDLVKVTDSSLSIKSSRHGEAVLKRSEVLSVRRLKGGGLVWAGPLGDVGWSSTVEPRQSMPTSSPEIPRLLAGPAGALHLPYWNTSATFSGGIPESLDLEFRVRTVERPNFKLSLICTPQFRFDVDTWDDEIVFAAPGGFQRVRTLAESDREVALRFCWNMKERRALAYDAAGVQLLEWRTPQAPADAKPKVVLSNKGSPLSLEFMRLREWKGAPMPKVPVDRPRMEMADGSVIPIKSIRLAADNLQIVADGAEAEQVLPMASVDSIIFSPDLPKTVPVEATLIHADGTFLAGGIESMQDGSALIKTGFSETPLKSHLSGLRQLLLDNKSPAGVETEKPFTELDKIVLAGATLHGKFVAGNGAQPGWMPIGGVAPVTLKREDHFEINRSFPPSAIPQSAPALFHTRGWDVLPGNLRSVDGSGVGLDSTISDLKHLPLNRLRGIQFGPAARMNIESFEDPRWHLLKGTAELMQRQGNSVKLEPGASLRHPLAMQAGEIKFSFSGDSYNAIRVRLFSGGKEGEATTNLVFFNNGNMLYAGLEAAEGQFAEQIRTNVASSRVRNVRLVIQAKQVEFYLNGVLVQSYPMAASKREGSGLVFEPAGMWGNTANSISLRDFSAHSLPGHSWFPDINAESKEQALMVPRFRKESPPRQALVAANGDVLRGEVEGATQTHFKFRVGLETLLVPRERVTAAIWLDPPAKEQTPQEKKSLIDTVLGRTLERHFRYSSGNLRSLISALKREAAEIEFTLPEKPDSRRFAFHYGGQTVGEALQDICKLFGLTYRVTGERTVVLEAIPPPSGDFAARSWWMNPGVFAKSGSVTDLLAKKGVHFPPGATAHWNSAANLLTVNNSRENLEKVAALVDTHFGGSAGSPTHWLRLSSGARFPLAVSRFESDFIVGNHPTFGVCKVPMSEISVIGTATPETPEASWLKDWRLVSAPEPVIPEAGGQTSALLGKAAKPFKLPLLGGGDFDLGREKGRVVVLDFWATWCAPCIKAMPEVIEALAPFPKDRVKLIGINQGEHADQVKPFIDARGWQLTVAMDPTQMVAQQYGVESFPHTIIVGPDGNVAWIKEGYSPDGAANMVEVIKQLLSRGAAETTDPATTQ